MTGDESGFGEFLHGTAAGQCAVVGALVIALHRNGVMPLKSYTDVLHQLWRDMPEDVAVGEAGAVIERMLVFLEAESATDQPSDKSDKKQEISATPNPSGKVDGAAKPAANSSTDGQRAPRIPLIPPWKSDKSDAFSLLKSQFS